MGTREASCSCGQLRITCEGEPTRVSMCHCLACQKRTGSAFGAQARFLASRVRVEGEATEWSRTADSGNTATFRFCPICGSTVYYTLQGIEDAVGVPIGGFADPQFGAPVFSVYEARKHPWVIVPPGAEHVD